MRPLSSEVSAGQQDGPDQELYNSYLHTLSLRLQRTCGNGTHLLVFISHLASRSVSITARHRIQRPAHVEVVFPPCDMFPGVFHGVPVSSTATFRLH